MSDTSRYLPRSLRSFGFSPYVGGTRTYFLNPSEFEEFTNFLYTPDILTLLSTGLFKDPLGGVMNAIFFPFDATKCADKLDISTSIDMGNISAPISTAVDYITYKHNFKTIDVAYFNLKDFGRKFTDFPPYTQMSLYLPFVGFVDLDVGACAGKAINIKYVIDPITGSCTAYVIAGVADDHDVEHDVVIQSFDGLAGFPIPFGGVSSRETAGNIASGIASTAVSIAGIVAGVKSGNVSLATAGVTGAASTAVTLMGASRQHAVKGSSASPSTSIMTPNTPYITVDRVVPTPSQNYAAQYGKPCQRSGLLSTFTGFTVVDTWLPSGFSCTTDEVNEITELLKEGVIL